MILIHKYKKWKKKNLYQWGYKRLMVVGKRTLADIRPSEFPLSLYPSLFLLGVLKQLSLLLKEETNASQERESTPQLTKTIEEET